MPSLDVDAMRQLWQRVLLQAVRDALGTAKVKDGKPGAAKEAAQEWIEGGGKDFQHVCALAGVEAVIVQDWWQAVKKKREHANVV